MSCPTPSAFERYVIGALSSGEVAELEQHTLGCQACADHLAREARLESGLAEAATRLAQAAPVLRPARWTRRLIPLAAAAAAVAVLWIGHAEHDGAELTADLNIVASSSNLLGAPIDSVVIDGLDDRMDGDDANLTSQRMNLAADPRLPGALP